jgi:plastocyanin
MRRVITLLLLLPALVVVGCGDDDDDDSNGGAAAPTTTEEQTTTQEEEPAAGGGAQTLTLVADPGGALKFDKTTLEAAPGEVTIVMDNQSDVPHAVEIEGNGVNEETETLTGGKAELNVDLKAGEYKFICPVGDHAQAGMEGSLVVR